jgi:hypothetical protein
MAIKNSGNMKYPNRINANAEYRHLKDKAILDNIRDANMKYAADEFSGHSNVSFEKQSLFTRIKTFMLYAAASGIIIAFIIVKVLQYLDN